MEILVAEDDLDMVEYYARIVRADGHSVTTCLDGGDALSHLGKSRVDLAILDLRMPVMDGYEVCRRTRAVGDRTPIMVLSGLSSEEAQLQAFAAGADDFVVKPCTHEILRARMRALLRRAAYQHPAQLRLGRWIVHCEALVAVSMDDGSKIPFSPLEMRLLSLLANHPNGVASRSEILSICYGGQDSSDNALAAVAARLRRKLQGSGMTLKAVRNHGLKLEPDPPSDTEVRKARGRATDDVMSDPSR
ncbi:MAG: response regulator transcription factor [Polyangiaceae bacterium]